MERFLDWKTWLYGLVATIINGIVSGVLLVIIDPAKFNIYDGRQALATASLAFGVWGACNYLKAHPLPDWNGEDRRTVPPTSTLGL